MPSTPVVLLATAASLAVCMLLGVAHVAAPPAVASCATAWHSWLDRRHQQAHVQQLLEGSQDVPEAGSGLAPRSAAALGGLAADAMRRVGWRSGVKFAAFDGGASLDAVLADSWRHAGAFLLIVPGSGPPERRTKDTPFLSIHPASNLTAALGPAAAALNTAAAAVEAALGRRLFAFSLETAPLHACSAGGGPCAVWEASSGRVVLDAALAGSMAAAAGAGADGSGLLAAGSGAGTAAEAGSGLSSLLAGFAGKLTEQVAPATALLRDGQATLPALAAAFAKAGSAAVTLAMVAAAPPLWWCIACPLVLGMLAPFVLNFGLTAAAEALCAQLHLPDDTCTDLWWGAFALALMLSLGAAVPIVYICRLPECGRHAAGGAGAAAATVARLLSR